MNKKGRKFLQSTSLSHSVRHRHALLLVLKANSITSYTHGSLYEICLRFYVYVTLEHLFQVG